MSEGLYLGKEVSAERNELGERLLLDPRDLLTHGLIVGMTGSGKTGLGIVVIEELLRQGIPVLAIDPKGDLGNLLLLFESLDAASFLPWIDPELARRAGKPPEALADEAAGAWRKGLAEWGLDAGAAAALKRVREAVIYTPGSSAGVPLNVLQSLAAPREAFDSAAEELREEIAAVVAGILGLLRIESDALTSKPALLLATLIEGAWRAGRSLSLADLIGAVSDPPFDKMGALPLETAYPRRERESLMLALNNLLAAPSFEAWRTGEPLEIARLLRAPDGRPRLSVIYTAHLDDPERLSVTALILNQVKAWMRRQGGTNDLRAVIYMDEIFGYFPPHPLNPPTKPPLLTLLKQARAQGVGVLLATQNPVDLDYRGLANMGLWVVGKLQTEQDRARLRDGLTGAGADAARIAQLLSATRQRVFLVHDVHRKAPCLLHSRWTLCYLRGPLTREEITRLRGPASAAPAAAASAASPATPAGESAPTLPAPWRGAYLKRHGGEMATPYLLVKYAVRYKGLSETVCTRAYALAAESAAEVLESEALPVDESALVSSAPAGLRYAPVPALLSAAGAKGIEKALRERLPDKLAVRVPYDQETKTSGAPGETAEAFAARLRSSGDGAARATKLREQIAAKERDIAALTQELGGRKAEKWAALGGAILANIGLFSGRKRTISGATTVLTKNRMENSTEAKIERAQGDLAALKEDLARADQIDPARFEERELVPTRGGVDLLRVDVVWIY